MTYMEGFPHSWPVLLVRSSMPSPPELFFLTHGPAML